MVKECMTTLLGCQEARHQLLPLLQARHGHVKARCLVDVETQLVQLESTSTLAQDTAVHLRAGCGLVARLPVQV